MFSVYCFGVSPLWSILFLEPGCSGDLCLGTEVAFLGYSLFDPLFVVCVCFSTCIGQLRSLWYQGLCVWHQVYFPIVLVGFSYSGALVGIFPLQWMRISPFCARELSSRETLVNCFFFFFFFLDSWPHLPWSSELYSIWETPPTPGYVLQNWEIFSMLLERERRFFNTCMATRILRLWRKLVKMKLLAV